MKILILSTHAIGDTFISLSSIEYLRSRYSTVKVHVLTHNKKMELLSCFDIDRNIVVNKKSARSILSTILQIRSESYDYIFLFIPSVFNTVLYLLSKAKNKAGFLKFLPVNNFHTKDWQLWKNLVKQNVSWKKSENYLGLVKKTLNIFDHNSFLIAKPKLNRNCNKQKYIVLHYESSKIERSLEPQLVLKICNHITNKYNIPIKVCSWTKSDPLISAEYSEDLINIVYNAQFNELEKLIASSMLFVGVDSFPIHIADAHNVKLLGLFYDTNPASVLMNYQHNIVFNKPLSTISEKEIKKIIDALDLVI